MTLPLVVVTLDIATPASAEQIARARSGIEQPLPSVTDLNLSIPIDREQSSSESVLQPNLNRKSITTPNSDQPNKAKAIRRRSVVATNINSTIAIPNEQPNQSQSIRRRNIVVSNINATTLTVSRESSKSTSSSKRIAAVSRPPLSGNYLRLVRDPSKGNNDNGNPIYTLEAYVGGEIYQTFNAVSGVATSQKLDRNRGNNHAPLPDGLYSVSKQIVPGSVPEVGRTFVAIYPQFETGRSDLGIHVDPSFNKQNGSDGTSGCIGLTTSVDRDAINEFILKYHPSKLFVSIMPKGSEQLAKRE